MGCRQMIGYLPERVRTTYLRVVWRLVGGMGWGVLQWLADEDVARLDTAVQRVVAVQSTGSTVG